MKKLELKELENIFGGISREEYCENLRKIIANNKLSEKALAGWTLSLIHISSPLLLYSVLPNTVLYLNS